MSQILVPRDGGGTITTITSTGGTITVTNPAGPVTNIDTVAPGFIWENTAISKTAEINKGYIVSNVGLVTITLPATAPVGSQVKVLGAGLSGWVIDQPAGVSIEWDTVDSTTIGTGTLASTDNYDSVELVCTTADLIWGVLNAKGNITIT